MRVETFELFRRAMDGDVDVEALERVRVAESPAVVAKIDLLLQRYRPEPWKFDTRPFRADFRKALDPRSRLDEVTVTALLYVVDVAKNERFVRSVYMPGSWDGARNWEQLSKIVFFAVTTILYDIPRWTSRQHLELDACMQDLGAGRAEALRTFLEVSHGIRMAEPAVRFAAERDFNALAYHRTLEFGPYFWRLVHWMAEAFPLRKGDAFGDDDVGLAKSLWREFVVHSLYRTLRCPHCMEHFRTIVPEYRVQILDVDGDAGMAELFFRIHDRINVDNAVDRYSRSEFEEDSRFMRSALLRNESEK